MPKAVLVSDIRGIPGGRSRIEGANMAGLAGKKRTCKRMKKTKNGNLRCAEQMPTSQCRNRRGKRCSGAPPISQRSKLYKRVITGTVKGAGGRCRTVKGRFKACR